ncbi:type II toxin-antitoxin system death-on-curing family toxin [Nocardia sp. NPDC059180]|uniref:type II toxin-antitoxin system death-on-curing family toxin n=1 Tax=Nocardia sp. NPDC059180 TaxID=3346761 RepID=UPI00368CC329
MGRRTGTAGTQPGSVAGDHGRGRGIAGHAGGRVTPNVLIMINSVVVGGSPEIRDAGLLAAAATRSEAVLGGREVYPTIDEKAAAVLHSVVRTRPFGRGNKATGWIACRMMLRCQGKRPGLPAAAAFDLIDELTSVDMTVAELVAAMKIEPQ